MPAYWYLRDLAGTAVSEFFGSERQALDAMGTSELLRVCPDSGRLHNGFGFTPRERPRMGERRQDPAWVMLNRDHIARLKRAYFTS
jgi:hypothetical protein